MSLVDIAHIVSLQSDIHYVYEELMKVKLSLVITKQHSHEDMRCAGEQLRKRVLCNFCMKIL
jgi:hypothetical protein